MAEARAMGAAREAAALPIVARGLRFVAGGTAVIDGIDLRLEAGPVTAVMGPNGAGKSLLLALLHGLIEPSGGGVSHGGLAPGAARARQAMVFQRPVLLRRSAAANLDFVLRARGGADPAFRDALLERVGLGAHARRPARRLSGGEQQRLALARALATRPEVLFLDEPTASLDPASALTIERIVAEEAARGVKVALVTHDAAQARRLAGEVVFLHRGRVAEHRPAAAFFAAPESDAARAYLAGRLVP